METVRTDWEQKVIDLALQGLSNMEISKRLDKELNQVSKCINTLGILNHPNYDLDLFQKIQMERSLAQRKIVDKDLLDDVVSLALSGFTYAEIASMFANMTENDVLATIDHLKEKSTFCYDMELYEKVTRKNLENIAKNEEKIFKRFAELEKNGLNLKKVSNSQLVQKYNTHQKVRGMVWDYLNSNMTLSDQYLATKYNTPVSAVSKIFNEPFYEKIILGVIDESTLQKIREHRKMSGHQKAKKSHEAIALSTPDISSEEKESLRKILSQMNLWFPILFTFQLSIEDLGILNNFKNFALLQKEVFNAASNTNGFYPISLSYLLTYHVAANEEERKKRRDAAKTFLSELSKAQLAQDLPKYKEMLEWLTDAKAKKLLKSKKDFTKLTEEELNLIIEYRIKYAIPYQYLPYRRESLIKNTPLKYQEKMKEVSDFNDSYAKASYNMVESKNEYLEKNNLYSKRGL